MIYRNSVQGPLSLVCELWEREEEAIQDETRTRYEIHETSKITELEKAGDNYQYFYNKHSSDHGMQPGDKALLPYAMAISV